jgi:hypothetical protein
MFDAKVERLPELIPAHHSQPEAFGDGDAESIG